MQCHNDAKGACDEIRLTNATMGNASGICDDSLSDLIQLSDGDHRWHFVERGAVDVKSVGFRFIDGDLQIPLRNTRLN